MASYSPHFPARMKMNRGEKTMRKRESVVYFGNEKVLWQKTKYLHFFKIPFYAQNLNNNEIY